MVILYLAAGIMFFMGIGIKYFKWYFLISGYNTMSKKQKQNVDVESLGKLMANFLFIMGALILISGIAQQNSYRLLSLISLLLIIPLTIVLIILAQRYDHNKNIKARKIEVKFIIGFMAVIIIVMSSLFIYGSKEPKVEIMSDRIVISGIYGTMIKKDKITEITLEDNIPKVLNKLNGFDLGYILRGIYKLEGIGSGSIYIHQNKSPYILIKTENKYYIVNYKDSNKTIELYNKLK